MAKRQEVDAVRQAATGRWSDILVAIGQLAPESLDGNHHPCPKCGGEDRFRMIDKDAGAVLCNQCFNSKNGDGFAAIGWLTGCKFPEAVDKVAEYLGIQPSRNGSVDPAKDLVFKNWSSELVAFFLQAKPGITEAGILAVGGRLAQYKRQYTVIAFPIIGESLDVEKPVGWVLVNVMGGMLPKWDKSGSIVGQVKHKTTYGSEPGLIGVAGVDRLKATGLVDVCWKTEGITDLLAVVSTIPEPLAARNVAISNAHGARNKPRWMAGLLARAATRVIHDADEPGQDGAKVWCQEIAGCGGDVRNVVLPYPIQKDHGKDVRDWLNEGNDYSDLLALADRSEPIIIKRTDSGEIDYTAASYPIQERILKKLQIEVLYETEDGRIRIFSWLLRKSSWIGASQVDKLKKERLVQICGAPAIEHISTDPDGESSWAIADVRTAIALAASARREEHNERGVGIWQGRNEAGQETSTIVLVGDTEAMRWNGEIVERIVTPRSDGLVLDFGAGHRDWFDREEIKRHIEQAGDAKWAMGVIDDTIKALERWRWKNRIDPTLVTGLILATWTQTIWDWRPLVSVVGQSNSGKSLLFEALGGSEARRGLFGHLVFMQAKSTEAGVRQGIGNTGRIILCDEFEKSNDRDRILEMLRASTRGQTISRGTSDQRGRTFTLRHLGWVAATETGLQKQPDLNRFVQLELLTAEKGKHGQLTLPENGQLYRLGQKLLAIAVRHAVDAKQLAVALKTTKHEGIDPRTIEVYAVPAAILARAMGQSDGGRSLLAQLLESVEKEDQGRTDHDDLLSDILAALIDCGGKDGRLSVGQIIESQSLYHDHFNRMEAQGIGVDGNDMEGQRLLVAHRQVASKLLRGTQWEGQRIDQVLMRIKGTDRTRARLGGQQCRVIVIPLP